MVREPVWLVIEWPEGESRPTKFFLTNLRGRMTKSPARYSMRCTRP